jgi:ZIP family zinc transporter
MADIANPILIGILAGLVPVYLGLMPIPLFRRLPPHWRSLLLSFSTGILMFLFADVTGESVEMAKVSPVGPLLFVIGLTLGLVGPALLFHHRRGSIVAPTSPGSSALAGSDSKLLTAYMMALGIGLHNFGEGLALGAAYGAGQFALTTALVVGFALHNGTEGLGIAGPVSDTPMRLRQPLAMGFIAGFPTIIGSVIGSLAYSELLGVLFFSVAGGALLFVAVELLRLSTSPRSMFAGIALGILLMYFTGLLLSV